MPSMPRARLSRRESQAQTRERLLESARQTFAKSGFIATTVDEIAEAAGFSKGAFYSNFTSKEAVFLELLQRHMAEEVRFLEDALEEEGNHQLDRIHRHFRDREEDIDWCLLAIEFQMRASRDPNFSAAFAALYQRQRLMLGGLIEAIFKKNGTPPPLPAHDLASVFMALTHGLALQRATDSVSVSSGLLGDAIRLLLERLLDVPSPRID